MKTFVSFFAIALSVFFTSTFAQSFDHDYQKWGMVLSKYVSTEGDSTRFNYRDLKADPKDLALVLEELSKVSKVEFDSWNSDQRLAFLINSYNAFTVKLIIDNYPVVSIKKIGGLFSNPWKIKFINLLDQKVNLDEIEHDWIRKNFKEPRIHFAVNCASIGCPALSEVPFKASTLDAQLAAAADRFFGDSKNNYFDSKTKVLWLSSIFKWYGSDFIENGQSLEELSVKHMKLDTDQKALIQSKKATIKYLDYDWNLNEKKK